MRFSRSGTSSRLYQALVYQQQLAQDAAAYADLREDASLFGLTHRSPRIRNPKTQSVRSLLRSSVCRTRP